MNDLITSSVNVIENVDSADVAAGIKNIRKFQGVINNTLKKNYDYGKIPGANKPALLKPGAEKILMLLGLTSEYEFEEAVRDYKKGFFAFTFKCKLYKGSQKVTEGYGHCNSMENKYRWRWVNEKDLPSCLDSKELVSKTKTGKYGTYTQYRIENDDTYSIANTIMKMAKKRAQIDATLTVGSLSEVFTQDFDDVDAEIQSEIKDEADNGNGNIGYDDIIINFGDFKGKSLKYVAENNIEYLKYLSEKAYDKDLKNKAATLYLKLKNNEDDDMPF